MVVASQIPRIAVNPKSQSPNLQASIRRIQPIDNSKLQKQLQTLSDQIVSANKLSARPNVMISPKLGYPSFTVIRKDERSIYTTMGLLRHAKSPEEVAFVISHELAHQQLKDEKRLTRRVRVALLLPLAVMGAAAGALFAYNRNRDVKGQYTYFKPLEGLTVVAAGLLTLMSLVHLNKRLSIRMEYKADRLAADYLTRAGFSPEGYKSAFAQPWYIWNKGWEASAPSSRGARAQAKILAYTHPSNHKRAKALDLYLDGKPAPEKLKPIMQNSKWNAFQKQVKTIYGRLELEQSVNLLKRFNLKPDPNNFVKLLKIH